MIHCGGQHHFVGKCAFHLATFTNGYVISTVGEYRPNGLRMESLHGADETSFYETMVFRASLLGQECGIRIDDYEELETRHYSSAAAANVCHNAISIRYQQKKDTA
jgi:hypothetical protein